MTSSILFEPLLTKPLHNSQFSHHWWGLHPAQACRSWGCQCSVIMASQILTDQLTLSQPRGQILPTTLLLVPSNFQTFLQPCCIQKRLGIIPFLQTSSKSIWNCTVGKSSCVVIECLQLWRLGSSQLGMGPNTYLQRSRSLQSHGC